MKKEEKKLVEVEYKIEKSGIKQQKLEDQFEKLSRELQRSKRNNSWFIFGIFLLIALLAFGLYYNDIFENDFDVSNDTMMQSNELDKIKNDNDSLLKEIERLKQKVKSLQALDSIENTKELVVKDSISIEDDKLESKPVSEGSTKSVFNDEDEEDVNDRKYTKQYAYINKAYRRGEVVFIEADFIEFFEGKRAVEKAKEYNNAEYEINKEGDTLYFLYNDYYIHNRNSKIRILELNNNIKIKNVNQISNGFPLKAFQRILERKPVFLLELRNGIVYRITEQKI